MPITVRTPFASSTATRSTATTWRGRDACRAPQRAADCISDSICSLRGWMHLPPRLQSLQPRLRCACAWRFGWFFVFFRQERRFCRITIGTLLHVCALRPRVRMCRMSSGVQQQASCDMRMLTATTVLYRTCTRPAVTELGALPLFSRTRARHHHVHVSFEVHHAPPVWLELRMAHRVSSAARCLRDEARTCAASSLACASLSFSEPK